MNPQVFVERVTRRAAASFCHLIATSMDKTVNVNRRSSYRVDSCFFQFLQMQQVRFRMFPSELLHLHITWVVDQTVDIIAQHCDTEADG
jgi:hypothetical protein